MISEALSLSVGSLTELAEELGLTRETLWLWSQGKRTPAPENRAKLAEALRRRGGELARLADELEQSR